jgi:hypothetical protein
MIKIKLYELDKHRNECAFRPYLWAHNVLKEIGIEFTQGDSYDFAWVAQASFLNKKVSLEQSVNDGLEFLSKIKGDYMLIDGQDSTSLIGTYEVFKESNATLLLKNCLLKDRSLYKQGWNLGRWYWGPGEYKLTDFDKYSDRIVLSGTNWLSTHWAGINVQWRPIERPKQYDISAMFQYPSTVESYEHGESQSKYYDEHRKFSLNALKNSKYKIARLTDGERLPIEEYYQKMFNSKIIFAPFGYGAIAIRDLEAAIQGSVLLKPDVSFVDTEPNVYIDGETYIACKHDFSDIEEKLDEILGNSEKYLYIIENARKKFEEEMQPEKLALHLHKTLKKAENIE